MLTIKDILASPTRSRTDRSPERRPRASTSTDAAHRMPLPHQPQAGPAASADQQRPFAQPAIQGPQQGLQLQGRQLQGPQPLRPQQRQQPRHPEIQSLFHAVPASPGGGESSKPTVTPSGRPPALQGYSPDVPQDSPQPSARPTRNEQPSASTPAPNLKRRRADSPSSSSPPAKRREGRPAYRPEEDDFIRFCRDDLCQSWECSTKLFNQTWHHDGTTRPRKVPGLQSRYYRLLEESVRDRKKATCGRPELGILEKTDRRYWWMTGAYTEKERAEMEEMRARESEQMPALEQGRESSGNYSSDGDEGDEGESLGRSSDEDEDEDGDGDGDEDDEQRSRDHTMPTSPSRDEREAQKQNGDNPHEHPMAPVTVAPAATDADDQHDLTDAVAIAKALKLRRQVGKTDTEAVDSELMSAVRAPSRTGSARITRRIRNRMKTSRDPTEEQSQESRRWENRGQTADESIDVTMADRES